MVSALVLLSSFATIIISMSCSFILSIMVRSISADNVLSSWSVSIVVISIPNSCPKYSKASFKLIAFLSSNACNFSAYSSFKFSISCMYWLAFASYTSRFALSASCNPSFMFWICWIYFSVFVQMWAFVSSLCDIVFSIFLLESIIFMFALAFITFSRKFSIPNPLVMKTSASSTFFISSVVKV